ncbi:Pup--protein ligase [Trueperella sp. HMSC08B05]|nr:Pup--protein ligase [Trueperella bernardiae]KTF05048.1 Pup--protein ligase [Trueperella bernardiae]OCW60893.1 Pup--protein ligase [Trueperella bernardiae]OFS76089.1 Pup--protein ligase [Trueperella sp. HMSC08B05]
MGIETEYGLLYASTTTGEQLLDPEETAHHLFEPLLHKARSTNAFLPNGARLYLDVGAHPEYATAECDQLADLLANDRAGDALYAQMAAEAEVKLSGGRMHLFKNNLDSYGNSFGCHENYLVRRRRDFRQRIDGLIPYFVTRQIMVGAGYLHVGPEGASYRISQRADKMNDAVSAATTRSRPMVNTRDEPHGDAELYRRMHVIVGDSNMCDATAALKMGATEAVLDAVEDGLRLPNRALADPVRAIREVSADTTCGAVLKLADGTTMRAIDIQREVHDLVRAHFEANGWMGLDPLRAYVFDLWGRTLDALERGDHDSLSTEIDWIAKRKLLGRLAERLGTGLDDARVQRLDLAWHDITGAGLRHKLEASGGLKKLISDDTIAQAMGIPPQTTRAKVRGDFVALAMEHRRDYMVDWMNIRLLEDAGAHQVLLKDPFNPVSAEVEELMEIIGE